MSYVWYCCEEQQHSQLHGLQESFPYSHKKHDKAATLLLSSTKSKKTHCKHYLSADWVPQH